MKVRSLQDLLVEELKDLLSAENQLVKALPRMAKAAKAPQLRAAFEEHLEVTRGQVARLEKVFDKLGTPAKAKKCKAMEGLLEEAKELLQAEMSPSVRDAALIASAQRVEHYEIAGYGCARTFATLLGQDQAAKELQATLDEEASADKKLTQLAETIINPQAEQPNEEPTKAARKPAKARSK